MNGNTSQTNLESSLMDLWPGLDYFICAHGIGTMAYLEKQCWLIIKVARIGPDGYSAYASGYYHNPFSVSFYLQEIIVASSCSLSIMGMLRCYSKLNYLVHQLRGNLQPMKIIYAFIEKSFEKLTSFVTALFM